MKLLDIIKIEPSSFLNSHIVHSKNSKLGFNAMLQDIEQFLTCYKIDITYYLNNPNNITQLLIHPVLEVRRLGKVLWENREELLEATSYPNPRRFTSAPCFSKIFDKNEDYLKYKI